MSFYFGTHVRQFFTYAIYSHTLTINMSRLDMLKLIVAYPTKANSPVACSDFFLVVVNLKIS